MVGLAKDYSIKIMMAYFEKFIRINCSIEYMLDKLTNELVRGCHQVDIVSCHGESGECFLSAG